MRKIWPSSYGTFPMGLYKDDNNELWVRKQGANLAHIKNEYEFMKYLDFIGVNVPECFMDDRYLYTKFIDGEVMGTNPSEDVIQELASDYVAHCLIANWDMIGVHGDNVIVTSDGEVYYVDLGGAGPYRALGEMKGDSFGPVVGEIESMKENNRGYFWFDKIVALHSRNFDLWEEGLKVFSNDTVRDIMYQRVEYLRKRFDKIN
tara:strand:+ start:769 stop:1380 length:612 start_codon:yes stop_codon:yes gene_type:complete